MKNNGAKKETKTMFEQFRKATSADVRFHYNFSPTNDIYIFIVNQFSGVEPFVLNSMLENLMERNVSSLVPSDFMDSNLAKIYDKMGDFFAQEAEVEQKLAQEFLIGDSSLVLYPNNCSFKSDGFVTTMEKPKLLEQNLENLLWAVLFRSKVNDYLIKNKRQSAINFCRENNIDFVEPIPGPTKKVYLVPVTLSMFPAISVKSTLNQILDLKETEIDTKKVFDIDKDYKQRKNLDVDISLGKPLDFSLFFDHKEIDKILAADHSIFGDLTKQRQFKKIIKESSMRIAKQHSLLVTVNHEHVFSYVLSSYKRKIVRENDFRNRSYFCLEYLKSIDSFRMHSSMHLPQSHLLSDDPFIRFDDFFHYAVAENLLERSGEYLILNFKHDKTKLNLINFFNKEFLFFAKDLKELKTFTKKRARTLCKYIRNIFLEIDQTLFEKDYTEFYLQAESKPRYVGAPVLFQHKNIAKRGVLLIHGYLAAPAEMKKMAVFLHEQGYNVYICRLRGHGTAPEDLASRHWEDWYESVNRGYIILKNCSKQVAVVGFSMGAGLALWSGSLKGNKFRGIISINAPLKLANSSAKLAPMVDVWNKFMGHLKITPAQKEFIDNHAENPEVNYLRNPISGITQLEEFMENVNKNLGKITAPVVIMQGSNDPVVNPDSGRLIFEKIIGDRKNLIKIFAENHVIVRGHNSKSVFKDVLKYLDKWFS